jgi:hypothetical protein
MHRSKQNHYSITSSTRDGPMPSDLAVLTEVGTPAITTHSGHRSLIRASFRRNPVFIWVGVV